MNTFIVTSLLALTSLLSTPPATIEKVKTKPKDTAFSESRIKLYPINKTPLRPGLTIDPNMPVAKLKVNSKMPVTHLDVNSKMPIAKLDVYIPPAQRQLLITPKRDSTRRNFKWVQP